MWITLYVVYLTVIVSCSSQVTNNDANIVTQTAPTNQEVQWDTTGPSVTVSIKDGRSDAQNRPRSEVSNHPLFYSNQWYPSLMPIGQNRDRDINIYPSVGGDDSPSYHFMPKFLRRPDSDQNRTLSSQFMQLANDFRYPYGSLPTAEAPINPMLFYPQHPNLFPSGNYHELDVKEKKQNSSASETRTGVSDAEATHLKDSQESIRFPSVGAQTDVLERFHPINFYRNIDGFLPSPGPVFLPYPGLPNANANYFNPRIIPYANNPIYNIEESSDVVKSIPAGQDVRETDVTANARDVNKQKASTVSEALSDSSTNFVPPTPLPLPFAGFPFGVLPPRIFPQIIPNEETLVKPVMNPVNLPKESLVSDLVLPYPSVTPNNPSSENSPDYLIPGGIIKPEAELPATTDADVERTETDRNASQDKIPYEFGYDMNDGQGTDQHRKEVSDVSGTVRGSYGYRDMFGVYRIVNYIADKNGFRAFIKSNEPGVATSGSANVVVLAERPPVQTIAEGEKLPNPEPVINPDTSIDLVAEGSQTKAV